MAHEIILDQSKTEREWQDNPEQRKIRYWYKYPWDAAETYAETNFAIGTAHSGDDSDIRYVMSWSIERQRRTGQCWIVVTYLSLVKSYAISTKQFSNDVVEVWQTIDSTPETTVSTNYPLGTKYYSTDSGWNGRKVTDTQIRKRDHSNLVTITVRYAGFNAYSET